ncbi:MAG: dihydropteroate synthase [Acetobacteraceae bacterium]
MGVLNVTPDSFSDGGDHFDPVAAVEIGLAMARDGADVIDIGGESTRPGAPAVSPQEELRRILPVVSALVAKDISVSVDTRNAATMDAVLRAGARIINDVSGLSHDPDARAVVARHRCPVVLMHMRGTPATMVAQAVYDDVLREVTAEISELIRAALEAGIAADRIVVDPGIGFAKTVSHSVTLLRGLPGLARIGYPILVGVSRKSFIGHLSKEADARKRLGGSLAAALFAISQGASIIRVHDVFCTAQAIQVWHSLS